MLIETKLKNETCQPYRANEHDAGVDLISMEDTIIPHGKCTPIHTGVSIDIPEGYVGLLFSRSGHARRGIRLANCVGVIDSGYQGEIIVLVQNDTEFDEYIEGGERVAQLIVIKCEYPKFKVVREFTRSTTRGVEGFGSTGK